MCKGKKKERKEVWKGEGLPANSFQGSFFLSSHFDALVCGLDWTGLDRESPLWRRVIRAGFRRVSDGGLVGEKRYY